MVPSELQTYLGKGGAVATLAAVVFILIKVLSTDTLNTLLGRLGFRAIPKAALPWLALGLGAALSALDAVLAGASPRDAAIGAAWGLLSGGMAVGTHETVGKKARRTRKQPSTIPTDPPAPPA